MNKILQVNQTLSPKNTDSQSKKLKTNFKNNILTATNTDDLLTANNIHVINGNTFDDIQKAIDRANPGDNIFLDGKTYTGSGTQIQINKQINIYGGSSITDTQMAILDGKNLSRIMRNGGGATQDYDAVNGSSFNYIKFINGNYSAYGHGAALDINGHNNTVNNCIFENSTCTSYYGGAMRIWGQNVTIKNSKFVNNKANIGGGAINCIGRNGTILNCTFINNTATSGGALWLNSHEIATVKDCTFINNTATNGGAII